MSKNENLQWVRKIGLVLAEGTDGTGGKGIDLSKLRIEFNIMAAAFETPNAARIRVWNPSDKTVAQCRREFTRVMLEAGYQYGAYGSIFDGTIRQYGWGRANGTDTYLDVFASDADLEYSYSVANKTLAAGASQAQVRRAIAESMNVPLDDSAVDELDQTGGILPRGKVLFGMSRDFARTTARTTASMWFVRDGKLVFCPHTKTLPGEPIEINMQTGMIGIPEQTDHGIMVRTLLNPRVKVGQRVVLNNRDIAQKAYVNKNFPIAFNQYAASPDLLAKVSGRADGTYQVYVIENHGDTRGQEWYSDLTLLSVDPSSQKVTAQ